MGVDRRKLLDWEANCNANVKDKAIVELLKGNKPSNKGQTKSNCRDENNSLTSDISRSKVPNIRSKSMLTGQMSEQRKVTSTRHSCYVRPVNDDGRLNGVVG